MKEDVPKSKLTDAIRTFDPEGIILRHEDVFTHGVPDTSWTRKERTFWWEIKLAQPIPGRKGLHFKSRGIQELTLLRLAKASFARYLIFVLDAEERRSVRIIHPRGINVWETSGICLSHWRYPLIVEAMFKEMTEWESGRRDISR